MIVNHYRWSPSEVENLYFYHAIKYFSNIEKEQIKELEKEKLKLKLLVMAIHDPNELISRLDNKTNDEIGDLEALDRLKDRREMYGKQ